MKAAKEHKPQQSRVISRKGRNIIQRYLVFSNYHPGYARGIIQNPVGVANPGNQQLHACHLIAHRFGGAPGGNNIVYMPPAANQAMIGHETRIYNYMHNHPNCLIDYNVVAQNFNQQFNTAAGTNTVATDISLIPNVQIL